MFDSLARRIAGDNASPERMGRRGFLGGTVKTVAAAIVATKSASLVTLSAEAQTLDPCAICIQQTGCSSRTEVTYYCDDYGNGYKCCGCGQVWGICDIVCVAWPQGCYTPNSEDGN